MTTDISPLTAIDRLHTKDGTDHSLLKDISRTLGLESENVRSERWKQKLREELVHEHIAAQKKGNSPTKSFFRRLFRF